MGEQTERGAKDKLYRNKCLHESVRVTTCVMKSGFSAVRTINNAEKCSTFQSRWWKMCHPNMILTSRHNSRPRCRGRTETDERRSKSKVFQLHGPEHTNLLASDGPRPPVNPSTPPLSFILNQTRRHADTIYSVLTWRRCSA